MPTIILIIILTVLIFLGGKFIFPAIGAFVLATYNGLVDVTFNLLMALYAIIPGHDFGVALIIFTILVRLAMWPLIKKQLRQTKLMQHIQPELKKIKAKAKGDKQLETRLMMELYREKGINPFSSIGMLLMQLPILLALYQVIRLIAENKQNVIDHTYGFVQNFGYMKEVTADLDKFSEKLFGTIDLTTTAIADKRFYIPLIIMALLAAIFQYFQSKQLLPQVQDKKTLREIFKDAGKGNQADQSDISAAMGSSMVKIFPIVTFIFAVNIQGALTLYLLVTALVGWGQQSYILGKDLDDMEKIASKKPKKQSAFQKVMERAAAAQEAKVVAEPKPAAKKPASRAKKKHKQGK